MTDYERYQQFYQQFNTVVHNHQEWLHSPEGTLAVLRDPWKAQPPIVKIDHPDDTNKAADILKMIRARHNKTAAVGGTK